MVTEYNGACNDKIRGSFQSLNVYFTIMLIILSTTSIIFIINISIESAAGGIWNPYGDIIPSYIGVVLLVLLIILIFSILAVKKIRNNVCKNDGHYHGILGGNR